MPRNNQLDPLDKEILNRLLFNARESYLELAHRLKVSNSLIHQRIKKMKKLGVIKGEHLTLDPKALGYGTFAYTGIALKEARVTKKVAKALEKIPEVVECKFVSGKYALFIKLCTKDNDHLQQLLYNKIHFIEGVASTDTFISFEGFERPVKIN